MFRDPKTLKYVATAAIFILLEIAAIGMLKHSTGLEDVWINRMSHRVAASGWGWSDNLKGYLKLREVNDALAEENFNLAEELRRYKSMVEENDLWAFANALPDTRRHTYVPARIVRISRNTQHNYIIVDKGSTDGITTGSGIITDKGVVGVISSVDKHYSYGLTLMNNSISVSARLGRRGTIAPLRWDGTSTDKARLVELPLHYEVTPGDTVWTSGFSAIFPAGIPMGTVRGFSAVDGASGVADVDLFQDFSGIRYVTIVLTPGKDEIESLER